MWWNSIFWLLLLALNCIASGRSAELVKKIKSSKNKIELQNNLIELGFSKTQFDSLNKFEYIDSNKFKPSLLKRAEVFYKNLSAAPGNEEITQVILESKSEVLAQNIIYFISIRSAQKNNPKILFTKIFNLTYCEYNEVGGMKFAFKANGPSLMKILFKLNVAENCGTTVSEFERIDTLRFDNIQSIYSIGLKFGEKVEERSSGLEVLKGLEDDSVF